MAKLAETVKAKSDQDTAAAVTRFFSNFPAYRYRAKQDVILAGHEPAGIYYIESGHIQQYDISEQTGLEVATHIFDPGSFFPLVWGLASQPNTYFYKALGPTRLRLAPARVVKDFLQRNPTVLMYLTTRLLRGLDGLSNRIKRLVLGNAKQRVYGELLYLARHFGQPQASKLVIHSHFSHQNIADLTGLARETVSHILEQAAKTGLITHDPKYITLEKPDLLARLVGE